jgi:GPH family glycoside/pentoside/hexuronide:cation symporter
MTEEKKKTAPTEDQDATRGEVMLYAFGNIEGALASQFYNVMNAVLIMSLGMNPLFTGLLLGIKTFWDGLTDPIMAHITDNFKSRWGRRRPFILVGGLSRILFMILIMFLIPNDTVESNAQVKAKQDAENAAKKVATAPQKNSINAHSAPAAIVQSQQSAPATTASAAVNDSSAPKSASTALNSAAQLTPATPALAKSDSAPATITPATVSAPEQKAEVKPLVLEKKKKGMWANIGDGFKALKDPANAAQLKLVWFVLFAFVGFTTLSTIMSVPYYALGIELSPSYDGRTQVVTYRSIMDKFAGLAAPWVLPFCYLTIFEDVTIGLRWYAIIAAIVGIPSTILMVMYTRERTQKNARKKRKTELGLFRSIWETVKNPHFLKILVLYKFFGFSIGIFAQIGLFLNVYWIFGGDKQAGTIMQGKTSTVAWVLAFAALPAVNWMCRRFQKHVALRVAIILMATGSVLKWWAMNPAHPEYQYILPLFFSVGISSLYTVLSTMMADVTDIDELITGTRREGMFGAVMAFLSKIIGTMQPIIAGAVLVASGFDATLGAAQPIEVITRMRLYFSLIPGVLCFLGLVLLYKYPLTRERMVEVKAELARRHAAEAEEEMQGEVAPQPA